LFASSYNHHELSVEVLVRLIQGFLPGCLKAFVGQMEATEAQLFELGTPPPQTKMERHYVLQDVLRKSTEVLKGTFAF
jgi:hypothetical protein